MEMVGFRIITVKSRDFVDQAWTERIFETLSQLEHQLGKRHENYSLEQLDIDGHLGFHLLADSKDRIVTFAGVYNGGRYPKGVFRILNRIFVHPHYRQKQFGYPSLATHHLLPYQMDLYKDDIVAAFVSREGANGKRFLQYWIQHHSPQAWGPWRLSDGFVKVAPDPNNHQNAFQYLAYTGELWKHWSPQILQRSSWIELKKYIPTSS